MEQSEERKVVFLVALDDAFVHKESEVSHSMTKPSVVLPSQALHHSFDGSQGKDEDKIVFSCVPIPHCFINLFTVFSLLFHVSVNHLG